MEEMTNKLAEYVCDICCTRLDEVKSSEAAVMICRSCKIDRFLADICDSYNRINTFVGSELEKAMQKNCKLEKELQAYKTLEEQGLLLKLHFGIGDVVYEVVEGAEGEYSVISRKCRTKALLCTLNEKVGKTVFHTKAEAEKALEEMEK